MDEVFGFVPPTATPPAKKPILTILKQAPRVRRRHGALDPEPGRPRLQGNGQRRHLDGRPPPDRERQGPRARGLRSAAGGTDIAALDTAIGGAREAPVHAGQRPLEPTRRVQHPRRPLDVDRPTHPRAGRAASEASRAARRRAPAAAPAAVAPPAPTSPAHSPPTSCRSLRPSPRGAGRVPRSRGAVGDAHAAGRCGRTSRRGSAFASTMRRRMSTSATSSRPSTDRSTTGSTSSASGSSTSTIATSSPRPRRARPTCSRARRSPRDVLPGGRARDRPPRHAARGAGAGAQRQAEARRAPGRDRRAVRPARRRGRPARRGRRGGQAPRPARGSPGPAANRTRPGAGAGRGATFDERSPQAHELAAGAGAVLGALFGGRRRTRSIAGALGRTAKAGQRRRTAEAKAASVRDDLFELEQELAEELQAIDAKWRAIAAEIDTVGDPPGGVRRARRATRAGLGAARAVAGADLPERPGVGSAGRPDPVTESGRLYPTLRP